MGGGARGGESRPMTATSPHKSIAARAGSWSARHKKTAIFGWIAFVLASLVLGGAIGTKQLEDTDTGSGDSGRADRMKQLGVGLAAAILIDATIVRAVLLPATMKLLGDANWYLPRWMGWIPKVGIEGPAQPARATA